MKNFSSTPRIGMLVPVRVAATAPLQLPVALLVFIAVAALLVAIRIFSAAELETILLGIAAVLCLVFAPTWARSAKSWLGWKARNRSHSARDGSRHGVSRVFFVTKPLAAFAVGCLATVTVQTAASWPTPSVSGRPSRIDKAVPMLTFATLVPRVELDAPDADDVASARDLVKVFATEPRSPLGRTSAGITREDALAFADRHLRGSDGWPMHRQEAAYWLKYATAGTVADPSLTWALTQLGSVFATADSGKADYRKARAVWHVAAALGDPIAYCFLGRMHEFGLGTARNDTTARHFYSRALSVGGCPGLAQSLSRLQ